MNDAVLAELKRESVDAFAAEPTRRYQSLSDRVRRSLSWLMRAAQTEKATPVKFVELWIALNALYGQRHYENHPPDRSEQEDFADFIRVVTSIDARNDMADSVRRLRPTFRSLIANPFLWNEYWRGERTYERVSRNALEQLSSASSDAADLLIMVFARLLVLRNQIVHGSAAADTVGNRGSVVPGVRVLATLVPLFVRVMIREGKRAVWAPVPYPRIGTPLHPRPKR
jgi:hypothetical protein